MILLNNNNKFGIIKIMSKIFFLLKMDIFC